MLICLLYTKLLIAQIEDMMPHGVCNVHSHMRPVFVVKVIQELFISSLADNNTVLLSKQFNRHFLR